MSLTLPEYSEAKGLPLAFLETLGVKQEATPRGPRIVIPYYGEDGREIAMRYRYGLNGKRFSWPEGNLRPRSTASGASGRPRRDRRG